MTITIMTRLTDLLSCSIIEKDSNGDVLWTWTYPSVSEAEKSIILRKTGLQSDSNSLISFAVARIGIGKWFYVLCTEVLDSDNLPRVKQLALVLFTRDFDPQKYKAFCRILIKTYCKTRNPTEILQIYLSAFTGRPCGTSDNSIYDEFNGQCEYNVTNVKGLIKIFELRTILIYTAILLKKRIFIYHHSLEQLLRWIQTFPALMKHRNGTDYLFPWIDLVKDELLDLKGNSYYIAGCTDSAIASRPELYDLLVNLPAREITVAPHAKESLAMTKTHKEIALFMVQLGENQSSTESQVISDIADKTRDLLTQLTSLATITTPEGKKMVSIETFKEKNLVPAVENFLINLGIAENLIML